MVDIFIGIRRKAIFISQ